MAWLFYLLFFLIPLVFTSGTSELFEYNKMMLTYALTVLIIGVWIIKMVRARKFLYKHTLLEIPLLLYLGAHVLSTIFSIDPHISVWGYYSRFHEGLLASISYILLYFAAVSNLTKDHVKKIFYVSFTAATLVALWGIMEHFGNSPSCMLITGKAGVDCWVQDVQSRVYATLGQPNWMAAYLDVLILLILPFTLERVLVISKEIVIKKTIFEFNIFGLRLSPAWVVVTGVILQLFGHQIGQIGLFFTVIGIIATVKLYFDSRKEISIKQTFTHPLYYLLLACIFFAALLFTKSRSGILGLAVGFVVFVILNFRSYKEYFKKFWPIIGGIVLVTVLFGLPFAQTEKLSLEYLLNKPSAASVAKAAAAASNPDINISESGDIRKVVWTGALKVWQRYPIFGSGVETFGYSYYLDRPVEHNMLSEWDFLYNKAHNEYLNILATTGTVGFLAYALVILASLKILWKNPALLGAYATILVTNFFGFSVVIIGIYFFLLPALAWILNSTEPETSLKNSPLGLTQIGLIGFIGFMGLLLELNLWAMWNADKTYALGKNYDSVQQYVAAYPLLVNSVSSNPGEPTFRDELAYNQSVLAAALAAELQGSTTSAIASLSAEQKMAIVIPQLGVSTADLVSQAIANSDEVIETSPNSLPFWKSRTKTFYQLGTVDPKYTSVGLEAIKKAAELAPTDARVHYTLGLLLDRNGQKAEAKKVFLETLKLKPNYTEAKDALKAYE